MKFWNKIAYSYKKKKKAVGGFLGILESTLETFFDVVLRFLPEAALLCSSPVSFNWRDVLTLSTIFLKILQENT